MGTQLNSLGHSYLMGGNLGIGTVTPSFQVDIQSATDNHAQLRIKSPGSPLMKFSGSYNGGDGAEIWQQASGSFLINVNSQTNTLAITSAGNVGFGTYAPSAKLHIVPANSTALKFERAGSNVFGFEVGGTIFGLYDYSAAQYKWRTTSGNVFLVEGSGNVGIGTTSPAAKLHVKNGSQHVQFLTGENTSAYTLSMGVNDDGVNFSNNSSIRGYNFSNQNGTLLKISNTGNVGIGTINPDAKLAVKGTIHTEEVRVDVNVPVPDYVFEKDYNLLSLSEVEAYVNQNKHLPEVPSAKEMEENGLNLKEMNLLLLKKVEELTLHLIEKEKQMQSIEKRLVQLEKK